FLAVVEEGRPELKGKLREVIERTIADPETGKERTIERRRADGGVFTADQAKKLGLGDEIGYLDDAVRLARKTAGVRDDSKAITYEKPPTLLGALLGIQAVPPPASFDAGRLANAATPRLWYLAPQSELAGLLAGLGQ